MLDNNRFQGAALAPDEKKFEKPDIGLTATCALFGRKLQKIFPLPSDSSEPENIGILLRKIQAKLDTPLVPESR